MPAVLVRVNVAKNGPHEFAVANPPADVEFYSDDGSWQLRFITSPFSDGAKVVDVGHNGSATKTVSVPGKHPFETLATSRGGEIDVG